MSHKYETVDGKMPEEFHKKHLWNEADRVIEIKCCNCGNSETVSNHEDYSLVTEDATLEQAAANYFYDAGWRYCELPVYGVEGVFCAGCILEDGGVESSTLQQPREEIT